VSSFFTGTSAHKEAIQCLIRFDGDAVAFFCMRMFLCEYCCITDD